MACPAIETESEGRMDDIGESGIEDGGPATRIAAEPDDEGCDEVGEVSAEKSSMMWVGEIGLYGINVLDSNEDLVSRNKYWKISKPHLVECAP